MKASSFRIKSMASERYILSMEISLAVALSMTLSRDLEISIPNTTKKPSWAFGSIIFTEKPDD